MGEAKFVVGQTVGFIRGLGDGNVPSGEFTILRVMPSEGNRRDYRVRSVKDGQERVLPEDQLEMVKGGWPKTAG
jgi:hypothetical protein